MSRGKSRSMSGSAVSSSLRKRPVELPRGVRVDDWEADAPFRYVRFREPPYTDSDLEGFAERIRPLLDAGVDVYAYFRHEDEPTAPLYAEKLLGLLRLPHP